MSRPLQIGEVADRVGLSLRTVRYYEHMGLVRPDHRSDGGFRLYTQAEVDRLRLIKSIRGLAFSAQEMRDLLDARERLSAAPEGSEHEAAADRLRAFAEDAARRCSDLREQLEQAEAFVEALAREPGLDRSVTAAGTAGS